MATLSFASWTGLAATVVALVSCSSTSTTAGHDGAGNAGAAGTSDAGAAGTSDAGAAGRSATSAGSPSKGDAGRAGATDPEELGGNGGTAGSTAGKGGTTSQGGTVNRGGATGRGGAAGEDGGEAGRATTVGGRGGTSGGAAVGRGGSDQGGGAGEAGQATAGATSGCAVGTTRQCAEGGLLGRCAEGSQSCRADGTWGDCSLKPKSADTCVEGNDDDCDGNVNEDCDCVEGEVRSCAAAGQKGNCAAGSQICDATGTFGACSIEAAAEDSCEDGDDANCNGTPNEGCNCVNGTTQPCGTAPSVGICHKGTSTCTNEIWRACEGEVLPQARDCTSSEDNDCDGIADDAIDSICQCTPGSTNPCGEHPGLDGVGICRAGTQQCVVTTDGSSSSWGVCEGSIGASTEKCDTGNTDEDCDGYVNIQCKATSCPDGTNADCQSILLPGGTFSMGRGLGGSDMFPDGSSNETPEHVATVSPFYLDKYEVNVARFRAFMAAYTNGWLPSPGQGTNPHVPGSGWNDAFVLPSPAELLSSLTDGTSSTYEPTTTMPYRDDLPIIAITWPVAFAFCIWDGGRLATDAEWEFAAAGGTENRLYPWGSAAPTTALASYGCLIDEATSGCGIDDILTINSAEAGQGRWGHRHLGGNAGEWVRDSTANELSWYSDGGANCDDCADLTDDTTTSHFFRGGGWGMGESCMRSTWHATTGRNIPTNWVGIRCARDL